MAALALTASAASAQAFDVPAGDLKSALDLYARQSRQQLIYRLDDVAGARSAGARNARSPSEALAQILAGSGLEMRAGPAGAVAIVRSGPAPATPRLQRAAMTTPVVLQAAAAAIAPSAPADPVEVEEVVITGSRIARRDYSANSPIVTVQSDALQSAGAPTVETYLNQLPQFAGSTGATSNTSTSFGQANLELRGLGRARTLVLLDGRRVVPANADGSVDVNILPRALVDNIEVITGGASAVYGSDAVAGVVNFKLKQNYEGMMVDAQYGATDRGDGESLDLSAVLGGRFNEGRGSAVLALSYSERQPVGASDRDFTAGSGYSSTVPQGVSAAIGANLPTQAAVDSVFAKYGVAAGVVNRASNFSFNEDGTLFSATRGVTNFRGDDPYSVISGPNFFFDSIPSTQLVLPMNRYSAFGRVNYELTSGIEAFGQLLFTHYDATVVQAAAPAAGNPDATGTGFWAPVNNPFIPTDLATILSSRPASGADFLLNKRMSASGERVHTSTYDTFQITMGLKGAIEAIDGGWDVSGSYGRNGYQVVQEGAVSHSAVTKLLYAADGGASICAGGYDPFGMTSLSPECAAYVNRTAKNDTTTTQQVVEANFQGKILTLPAGEVRFAAGASYREDNYEYLPDSLVADGDLVGILTANALNGSTDVRELYGELLVPVARDLPFVEELNLGVGYRYSDYSSVGGVSSYKAEFDWRAASAVRLRGGYQRAVRAPSIGELYLPASKEFVTTGAASATGVSGDPCDVNSSFRKGPDGLKVAELCLVQGVPAAVIASYTYGNTQTPSLNEGNPDLTEETADTFSMGLVWTPAFESPWLARLNASLDYYSIDIKDAVGVINTNTSLRNCFNLDGANPTYSNTNSYCSLISRDHGTGEILTVLQKRANLGRIRTSGWDFVVDWRLSLDEIGAPFSGLAGVNLMGTHLDKYEIKELPTSSFVDYRGSIGSALGTAYPEWKLVTTFSYELGPLRTAVKWRYIDAMKDRSLVGGGAATAVSPSSVSYLDFDARWIVNETIELRVGGTNLTDKDPPPYTSAVSMNTDPSTYDVLGRRFYVGLRARF